MKEKNKKSVLELIAIIVLFGGLIMVGWSIHIGFTLGYGGFSIPEFVIGVILSVVGLISVILCDILL